MNYAKKYTITNFTLIISLSILTSLVILLLFSCEPFTRKSLSFFRTNNRTANISQIEVKDELQMALEKVSMANKTLIIAIVNGAYVEGGEYPAMFDLFLEGFWAGEGTRPLVGHLLVVSMDRAAHERCVFRRLNCYMLEAEGGDDPAGEKVYMSDGFIEMMWRRTVFLLDVLSRGFSFIFTDTDVLWLRNPFPRLNHDETIDLHMSTDVFNGNSSSEKNLINTGFYFIRSNEKTVSLFQTWYDMRSNATGLKEQDVLANLIKGGVLERIGINAKFLDTLYFSGFCTDSRDVKRVTTVHANCCRSIRAKVADLKMVLKDWKRLEREKNIGVNFQWSRHTSCINSWFNRTN